MISWKNSVTLNQNWKYSIDFNFLRIFFLNYWKVFLKNIIGYDRSSPCCSMQGKSTVWFATLRLRRRLQGRDGCQSALWDCFGGQMCRHVVNASPKTVPQCTWQPCRPGLPRNLEVANSPGLVVFAIWDFKLLKYFKTNLNFLINSPGPKALFHLIWQGQICT